MFLQGIDTLGTLASKYFYPLFVLGNRSAFAYLPILKDSHRAGNIKEGKLLALCKLVLGILQLSMISAFYSGGKGWVVVKRTLLSPYRGHSQLDFLHIQGKDHLLYQRAETLGSTKNKKNVNVLV